MKPEVCGRSKTPEGRAEGYFCTREKGHDGPCAMKPGRRRQTVSTALGEAIGEAMFGGGPVKKIWAVLSKVLTHAAVYAAEHPDQVIAVVNAVKAAR
jgi:hypothetical protein